MDRFEILSEKEVIAAMPEGDIVSRYYPDFENAIKVRMGATGKVKYLLNLEKVRFINSSVIIFLIRLKNMVASEYGYMVIYNPPFRFKRVIIKLRLEKLLYLRNDGEECFNDILNAADSHASNITP